MKNYIGQVEQLLYGIPDYHLPKDVLLYEIERIKAMGVEIKAGVKVGEDIALSQLRDGNDAVLIATGSKDPVKLDTPGIDLKGIYQWISISRKRICQWCRRVYEKPKIRSRKRSHRNWWRRYRA